MKESLKKSLHWSWIIAVITLVLAAIFAVVSTFMLSGVAWGTGMVIVFSIVLTGVISDTIGVAATAAEEKPFHAMAAKKLPGAWHAMRITRNADRFANFCNDVVGDIAGVVSGTASAYVVLQISLQLGHGEGTTIQFIISVIFTSVVAALTVGGKSVGKTLAMTNSTFIIYHVGRLFYLLEVKLKITVFKGGNRKDRNRNKKKKNK
ncbi:hypothetical protein [Texcoconibacillus texcoconensis]|uniref:CBS domain containing-hemolysin-like protein n=1 Tax=Texcoconibacillus texcoconensis TaxID=1095777 RepID=A0A840QNW4_9BACI|nr:hypothetical protein [Texcoconibacillus texcoconensis]MBB5173065.1 CBS domain containing-hemolysin-like protein [Texcoconibacillus texcoconensis]